MFDSHSGVVMKRRRGQLSALRRCRGLRWDRLGMCGRPERWSERGRHVSMGVAGGCCPESGRGLVWLAMECEPAGDMVGFPGREVVGLGWVHTLGH